MHSLIIPSSPLHAFIRGLREYRWLPATATPGQNGRRGCPQGQRARGRKKPFQVQGAHARLLRVQIQRRYANQRPGAGQGAPIVHLRQCSKQGSGPSRLSVTEFQPVYYIHQYWEVWIRRVCSLTRFPRLFCCELRELSRRSAEGAVFVHPQFEADWCTQRHETMPVMRASRTDGKQKVGGKAEQRRAMLLHSVQC